MPEPFAILFSQIAGFVIKYLITNASSSEALGEILGGFGGDFSQEGLKQKAISLTADQIATSIATGLRPRFEEGGKKVKEFDEVIFNITDTLGRINISSDLVQSYRDSPNKLTEYIKSITNQTTYKHLSATQKSFHDEVINHTSETLIRMHFDLPKSMTDLYASHRKLVDIADKIVEDVARIKLQAGEKNLKKHQEFEIDYRKYLEIQINVLELFGLSNINPFEKKYELEKAYTELWFGENGSNSLPDKYTISELLVNNRTILIKGEAGTGKTTILKWIALSCLCQHLKIPEDILNRRYPVDKEKINSIILDINQKLPIFLNLREYNKKPLPQKLSDLIGYRLFLTPIIDSELEEYVYRLFSSGKAILLIDGIDELTDQNKREEDVRDWIISIAQRFPKIHIIATSRPGAVKPKWLKLTRGQTQPVDFKEIYVKPLELESQKIFIHHWHNAIASRDKDDKYIKELPEKLIEKLITSDSLQQIATTPLLCAAICAMHKEPPHDIPHNRRLLYDSLIKMLIEKRDKERDITEIIPLDIDQKIYLFRKIAIWMLKNDYFDISDKQAEERVEYFLKNISPTTPTHSTVRYIFERSGLIREKSAEKYEFVHGTFLEYLSAQQICEEADYGYLESKISQQRFYDLIYFSVINMNVAELDKFMYKIIEKLKKDNDSLPIRTHDNRNLFILALKCANDSIAIDSSYAKKLISYISIFEPPNNINEEYLFSSMRRRFESAIS